MGFAELSPDKIVKAAELQTGLCFDGTIMPYNSYVNRVFGLTDEDGNGYIIKFYRPNRWNKNTIQDEHNFLVDCTQAEIPTIAPILAKDNSTIGELDGIYFAVFPRVRAHTFDIYTENDWIRAGRAIGRLHEVSKKRQAPARLKCTPEETTEDYIKLLLGLNDLSKGECLVHPYVKDEFIDTCDEALDYIEEAFNNLAPKSSFIRIHGDCHRGNMLETSSAESRDGGVITLIDFDDMMEGPAIQDLWLLLPGYQKDSMRELNLLLEGYEEFNQFDRRSIALIEPLRFMRNIYFLAWNAIQFHDVGFTERNPDWGSKSFWITETEDLKTQLNAIKSTLDTEIL